MHRLRAKVFGGSKKNSPDSKKTIQELREMEELLSRKQEFIESKINDEIKLAKKFGLANKKAAMQALMRKRRYQKQLQQIDGTLTTLELQRETLEMAHANTSILKTMTDASKALKTAHAHLDMDQVHDMMDDIAEQQEVAREIADVIANPISFGESRVDEEELEKELEAMEQEELDRELLTIPTVGSLDSEKEQDPPTPSTTKYLSSETKSMETKTKQQMEDEDILKELEQWGVS